MPGTFVCTLITPERQVLDEQATYASIPAWDGQVGIMNHRAPLLAKLGQGLLRIDLAAGGSRWFYIGGGFAQMRDNRLALLTTDSVAPDEVARPEAEAALREAEARVATTDEEQARRQREVNRARGLLDLLGHAGG